MCVGKSLALLVCAAALAPFAAAKPQSAASDQAKAIALLVRAFDRVSPCNIVAIMRMAGRSNDQTQTVEVQIAADGRQRLTVLQPIQHAGLIILDLGSTRQIYDPDKQVLTIGESPSADLIEAGERGRLVKKNYSLRVVKNIPLAGCEATRIDATSRHSGFGGLSIYIDPKSYFVLRVDCRTPDGTRTRRFDTKSISYPESLDSSTFELTGLNFTSTEHESVPTSVRNLSEARRRAGFTPLAPHNLPFGFIVRKTYVRVDPAYKSIGFNISDGLTAATVFEFSAATCPPMLHDEMKERQSDFFQSGDTIVGIVSDLDPKIRAKLLKAFKATRKTSQLQPENIFRLDCGTVKIYCFGTVTATASVA